MNQKRKEKDKVTIGALLESKTSNPRENSVTLISNKETEFFEPPKKMPKLQ